MMLHVVMWMISFWGRDVLFEEIIKRFRFELTVGSEEKTDVQYLGVHMNMLENGLFIS